tara:strand:+ start:1907 stop:2089 length:183 start_codon:yes stop_codon:yes gene_type:complete
MKINLMKPAEVCKALGVSKKTLLKYKDAGKLRVVMINSRTFRYYAEDVQAMIENNERRAA